MAEETRGRADSRASPRAEAAEIQAWQAEKARRWPRRARILAVRVVAACICALVAFVVLEQVISLTATSTQGVARSSASHQQ